MVENKKAAMELSIGTIVILVLAMVMLIGGIILVRTIFTSSTDAIGEIDKGVRDEITKAFSNSDKKLVIYPSARTIELKQKSKGKGFAFSVRNMGVTDKDFTYKVYVDPQFDIQDKCRISASEAESWLDISSGSISVPRGSIMEYPELILFTIPDNAPPCTIKYNLDVSDASGLYSSTTVHLVIVQG